MFYIAFTWYCIRKKRKRKKSSRKRETLQRNADGQGFTVFRDANYSS